MRRAFKFAAGSEPFYLFVCCTIFFGVVRLPHVYIFDLLFQLKFYFSVFVCSIGYFIIAMCFINLAIFADMLNHSFQPNCFFHWRFKDRMLEVMINAGQQIRKGDEVRLKFLSVIFSRMSICMCAYKRIQGKKVD